jgi:hypothetical protein
MPRTQCRNRHVPDGLSPRTGTGWAAQAPNAGRVRPSTGARCGKAARRDLRGGREVTPAPTATSGAGYTPSMPRTSAKFKILNKVQKLSPAMGGRGTCPIMTRSLAILLAIVPSFIRTVRSSKRCISSTTKVVSVMPVANCGCLIYCILLEQDKHITAAKIGQILTVDQLWHI